jgi:hypothetical protein
MPRRAPRPTATSHRLLEPQHRRCWVCDSLLWVADHSHRTVTTFAGLVALTLVVRTCRNRDCSRFHQPYRPEEEGVLALPQGEFGLEVIALVGTLRFAQHRSVPEIHQALVERNVSIAERTVTHLLYRYEELVALRLADQTRLQDRLREQGRVILALDGLQPDGGHEVLWLLRDVLSGAVLLARSLLRGTTDDLATLIQEVKDALPVPIAGVISDGQHPIRRAVKRVLPGVPYQLCQFHYLRDAAKPVYEADRHAKKLLKKEVRGVRPIEREGEGRDDAEAQAIRGDCAAVRSALTDEGRPPLAAAGLRLQERLQGVSDSLSRVAETGGFRPN